MKQQERQQQRHARGRASGSVAIVSLAGLIVAAAGVACGSVGSEPFGLGAGVDAAATPVATSPPSMTASATTSASAPPVGSPSTDSGGPDASSTPMSACPTEYAQLVGFLNSTVCGACAGTRCAALSSSCFDDCACITGALAVFGCSVISSDISDCIGLAGEIPAQYQAATYVCAMTCKDVCSSTGSGPADAGTSDAAADSGADSGS